MLVPNLIHLKLLNWLKKKCADHAEDHKDTSNIYIYYSCVIAKCNYRALIRVSLPLSLSPSLSDQGQGHGAVLKFFSIYRNTNCQVP